MPCRRWRRWLAGCPRRLAARFPLLLVLLLVKPLEGVELAPLLLNKLVEPPLRFALVLEILASSFAVSVCCQVGSDSDLGKEAPMESIWGTDWGVVRCHLGGWRRSSSLSCLAGRGGRGARCFGGERWPFLHPPAGRGGEGMKDLEAFPGSSASRWDLQG